MARPMTRGSGIDFAGFGPIAAWSRLYPFVARPPPISSDIPEIEGWVDAHLLPQAMDGDASTQFEVATREQ